MSRANDDACVKDTLSASSADVVPLVTYKNTQRRDKEKQDRTPHGDQTQSKMTPGDKKQDEDTQGSVVGRCQAIKKRMFVITKQLEKTSKLFKVEFKLELPVHGFEEQGAAERASRDADRGAAGARRADEHVEAK